MAEKMAREKEAAYDEWKKNRSKSKNPRRIQRRGSFISISSNNSGGIQIRPIKDNQSMNSRDSFGGMPIISDFT